MRRAALLPLLFFACNGLDNWQRGVPAETLWMCHLSNLALGVALAVPWLRLGRASLLWILIGIPLWLHECLATAPTTLSSSLTHLGGLAVGCWAMPRLRLARPAWTWALGLFLVVQEICRLATPPKLNVNLAHSIYDGAELVFSAYWQYWLFTTAATATLLFLVDRLLGQPESYTG